MRAYAAPFLTAVLLVSVILGSGASLAAPSGAADHDTPAYNAPAHNPSAYTENGEASWYGPRHEGKRTTSGERFDSNKLTAAHPSLPMGSWVRVTVTDTGKSIVVRVNDREPPHGVRCIDLTRAAAARLGIVSRGVADVRLAQISREEAMGSTELAEAPADAQPVEASAAHPRLRHRARRHR